MDIGKEEREERNQKLIMGKIFLRNLYCDSDALNSGIRGRSMKLF